MGWMTARIQTDAADSTILADTGPLGVGIMSFTIILWADTPLVLDIVLRDALDTIDVSTQRWTVIGGSLLHRVPLSITTSLNQRILVRVATAYKGNAQASILS